MSKDIIDLALNQIKGRKNPLDEMTAANGAGAYSIPLTPGTRIFDKDALEPYTIKVSKYDDAQLAYDSYDGKLNVPKKKAKQMEKNAIRISKYKKSHPNLSDDDGDIINQIGKSIKEASSVDGGLYNGPIELGLKKWKQGVRDDRVRTPIIHQKL